MNKPLHFFSTGSTRAASNAGRLPSSRGPGGADHPTPQGICFDIGVILAVTLAIACAVPLALSFCGLE